MSIYTLIYTPLSSAYQRNIHSSGPDGFVLLSAVFPHVQAGVTVADVERIVRESDKQRFKLQDIDGQLYVRANQGHSISTVPCPLPELL